MPRAGLGRARAWACAVGMCRVHPLTGIARSSAHVPADTSRCPPRPSSPVPSASCPPPKPPNTCGRSTRPTVARSPTRPSTSTAPSARATSAPTLGSCATTGGTCARTTCSAALARTSRPPSRSSCDRRDTCMCTLVLVDVHVHPRPCTRACAPSMCTHTCMCILTSALLPGCTDGRGHGREGAGRRPSGLRRLPRRRRAPPLLPHGALGRLHVDGAAPPRGGHAATRADPLPQESARATHTRNAQIPAHSVQGAPLTLLSLHRACATGRFVWARRPRRARLSTTTRYVHHAHVAVACASS